MRFSALLGTLILVFSGSTFAASSDAIQLDVTKANFELQQNNILKAINTDVNYGEISTEDRALVTQSLADIAALLKGSFNYSTAEVGVQQQILATQEKINAILVQARKDSRLICRKEPVLGSNFDKKVCNTAATLKRQNDKVRDQNSGGQTKVY